MMPFSHNIQILQAWFSPSFPLGSFAYSHGLETAIQGHVVTDKNSLTDWIAFILEYGSGWNDGLCLKAAHQGEEINDLCLGLSAGHERQLETQELGRAFTATVNKCYGLSLPDKLAYPIAVGIASAQLNLDLILTLQSYLQSFASNLISVGIRTIPVGQMAGQECLVRMFPIIETLCTQLEGAPLTELGSCAFIADLMSLQHEQNVPRLYRT
jgi:urease accessory protein